MQICKYANEKMSKCRKPQVLGQRSVASPQLGNWLQNLIQHLGISNPLEYTRILAQNNWEYKIPRIHTNIGTKHFGISNPLEYTLISAQNNWEYQIP